MDIANLREQIDGIDEALIDLFNRRMAVSAQIAACKKEQGLPIFDPAREQEKLRAVAQAAGPETAQYARSLYTTLFELSRSYQSSCNRSPSPLEQQLQQAMRTAAEPFPSGARVACQGVAGAYSQIACQKLFSEPDIVYCKDFEDVYDAIDRGLCRYGILPLENSTAGSVKEVYELMNSHDFYILRSLRLQVEHHLLANPGARLEDIREICSHEQALNQCSDFLDRHPHIKVVVTENTAVAAETVARSGRKDMAALCNRSCEALYGLNCLLPAVQNESNNQTRFICIGKKPQICPGSDRTSLMMVLDHRPGALYSVLAKLYTLGINITKLDSEPLPGRDFEMVFYLDLQAPADSGEFMELLCQLQELCAEFKYLGSYSEVAE